MHLKFRHRAQQRHGHGSPERQHHLSNLRPAGAFVLKDLYPTSSGGDLAVTIQENDGSKTQYTLPFASVPNLVRNGQVKYALGAGKYRPTAIRTRPLRAGELFYGWRYGLTF